VFIVKLKLKLERAVGKPPAGPQQGHDLIKYLIKVHHQPPSSASSSAIGTLEQFALASTKISGGPLRKSPALRAAPFVKGGFRGFCVYLAPGLREFIELDGAFSQNLALVFLREFFRNQSWCPREEPIRMGIVGGP